MKEANAFIPLLRVTLALTSGKEKDKLRDGLRDGVGDRKGVRVRDGVRIRKGEDQRWIQGLEGGSSEMDRARVEGGRKR